MTPAVLLMCGGPGTRMRPWSDRRHKCLVGLRGGEPLFAWHLRNVASAMPGAVVHGNVPKAWLREYKEVAAECGVRVKWIPEADELVGSGNRAMALARRRGSVLVLYGDTWFAPAWYKRMVPAYGGPFAARIGVEGLPARRTDWRGFVLLRRDAGDEVACGMAERPSRRYAATEAAFHMGMSVFTRAAAEVFYADKALSSRTDVDLFSEVVPSVVRSGVDVAVVRGGAYNEESADLGTLERYAEFVVKSYLEDVPAGSDEAVSAIARARRVAVAGNGGACCVASHAALDWCKAGRKWTATLMEPGMLSAWSNDVSFDEAVAKQVVAHEWEPDDALVLLSTSGRSRNVLAAARAAKALKGARRPRVVALTCSERNPLSDAADVSVVFQGGAPKNTWSYGPMEDAMSAWCHAVTAALEGLAPWPGR